MNVVKYKSVFLGIALVLMLGSLVVLLAKGIRLGTEFSGGTVVGISATDYRMDAVSSVLEKNSLTQESVTVIPVDSQVFELRFVGDAPDTAVVSQVTDAVNGTVVSETTTGPSLGKELGRKSLIALALVLICILIFISYAFRHINDAREKMSLGPNSWVYGAVALVALLHDVLIPTAIFSLLGKEITSLYVVGMLSILGLSISDTIVVFDRIRERMLHAKEATTFAKLVGQSISDTMTRSINTSGTLIFALLALFIFGPTATHDLALVMLLGAFFGTYSSIFVASPLLVLITSRKSK